MGKKIFLSESQVKEYMRHIIKEVYSHETESEYEYYANKLEKYASIIRNMPNVLNEIKMFVSNEMRSQGINFISIDGDIFNGAKLKVDITGVEFREPDVKYDETEEEVKEEKLSRICEDLIFDVEKKFRYYIEEAMFDIYDLNSDIIEVKIKLYDDWKTENLRSMLPDI